MGRLSGHSAGLLYRSTIEIGAGVLFWLGKETDVILDKDIRREGIPLPSAIGRITQR